MRIAMIFVAVLLFVLTGCQDAGQPVTEKSAIDKSEGEVSEMAKLLAKFAPTKIGVEDTRIPEKHRGVIKKLVEAAEILDDLFLLQVDSRNKIWREKIAGDPGLEDSLTLFDIMYGPWNRLDHNKPFWGNVEKPKGANYYPQDITKEEVEQWITDYPGEKEAFTGYFTRIERDRDGLKAVPYAEVYKGHLDPAARLLNEAAGLAGDTRLKKYLKSRAAAFLSNEYRQSDMDWMDLGDGDIEVVIGPYEVYEDELFGYKAAFEAFITIRDPVDSAELEKIKSYIPDMEKFLPIPDEHKNLERGSESPISVVDVLFTAGDTRAGVQTLAFNLPNDEVVREKKGSKKVMLRNVIDVYGEYLREILVPILPRTYFLWILRVILIGAVILHDGFHRTDRRVEAGYVTTSGEYADRASTSVLFSHRVSSRSGCHAQTARGSAPKNLIRTFRLRHPPADCFTWLPKTVFSKIT